jgi:ribosomal protein L35
MSDSDEDEPPHPLGFDNYGRTRFGLSPSSCTRQVIHEDAWNAPVGISRLEWTPPKTDGLHHPGIRSSTLLRGITDTANKEGGMDRIETLLKAASLNDTLPSTTAYRQPHNSKLMQLARAATQELQSISLQMSQIESQHTQTYQSAVHALTSLLQADAATVSAAQKRIDERKSLELQQQEAERQHQLHLEQQEQLAQLESAKREELRIQLAQEEKRQRQEKEEE